MTTLDTLSGKLDVAGQKLRFIDLPRIFGDELKAFPMAMRIIIENALRNAPEEAATLIARVSRLARNPYQHGGDRLLSIAPLDARHDLRACTGGHGGTAFGARRSRD
jgi:hypothetical protein